MRHSIYLTSIYPDLSRVVRRALFHHLHGSHASWDSEEGDPTGEGINHRLNQMFPEHRAWSDSRHGPQQLLGARLLVSDRFLALRRDFGYVLGQPGPVIITKAVLEVVS